MLYFAPLYLEGIAQYWEFLIFAAGVILMLVEVIAVPGFGVAGVAGIIAMVTGLTLSMVDNEMLKDLEFTGEGMNLLMRSFGIVVVSSLLGLVTIDLCCQQATLHQHVRQVGVGSRPDG